MRRLTVIFAPCLLLLSACAGSGGGGVADSDSSASAPEASASFDGGADMTAPALFKADSVLAGMTLEEKVGQCFMPSIYAQADPYTLRRLREYVSDLHVGGVVLLKGDLQSAAKMGSIAAEAPVPLFVAIDAEWGLGMRLEDAPDFPRNGRISPKADEQLLFDYGREVARESRRVGINMILGPVVDVVENPRGIIGSRSFGNDPRRVADLGVAYARGVESGRVISVAKHFPGHGSPSADSHRSLPVIERSLQQLDSIDLYPFRSYIDAGLSGIMAGHLAVPAIDPEALPAAVSPVVIGRLLRGDLEFKGLVLTDALNMAGAQGHDAAAAIAAGADIVVAPEDTRHEIDTMIAQVRKGSLPLRDLDDRVRRILFYKYLIADPSASASASADSLSLSTLYRDIHPSDSLYHRLSQ